MQAMKTSHLQFIFQQLHLFEGTQLTESLIISMAVEDINWA